MTSSSSSKDEIQTLYQKGTRLYLSQINSDLGIETLQQELERAFQVYGTVQEVFIPTRSTKLYAFIRFNSPEEAQNALDLIPTPHRLFKRIKSANDVTPRNQKRDRLKQAALKELKERQALISKTNIICQSHASHYERLESFLRQHTKTHDFEIVGSMAKTTSRTISLVFVNAKNRQKFCEWLRGIWFIQNIVHRTFLIDNPAIQGNLEIKVVTRILESLSKLDAEAKIRLQAFPPKLALPILNSVEARWDEFDIRDKIEFAPKKSTHVLGLVQVVDGIPEIHDGLFCVGLWKSTIVPLPTPSPASFNNFDNDICRAYYKLQESFERYKFALPKGSGLNALDCGAAPGGWTQYVARNLQCQTIYSIDPGALAPSVLQIPTVDHMQMTIQKALPTLQEGKMFIDVWVSDMCVKDMEQQIDWLLKALEMKVVGKGTFFVLTLKCISGHSSETFDRLVGQQLKRLQPLAKDLQVVHLFFNRYSERTILGYFE